MSGLNQEDLDDIFATPLNRNIHEVEQQVYPLAEHDPNMRVLAVKCASQMRKSCRSPAVGGFSWLCVPIPL